MLGFGVRNPPPSKEAEFESWRSGGGTVTAPLPNNNRFRHHHAMSETPVSTVATDRIGFRCACANALSAPASWRGRTVRCPACGALQAVPDVADTAVLRELDARETARTAPDPEASPLVTEIVVHELDGAIADVTPSPDRRRLSPRTRRILIAVALTAAAGGFVAGMVHWRNVYKRDFSAAGIMEQRGFGRRVQGAEPSPLWLYETVARLDSAWEAQGRPAAGAVAMAAVFRWALENGADQPGRVWVMNNAAWFLATVPWPGLREPVRALRLARAASAMSNAKEAVIEDTLAQALYVNGRVEEALRTELHARELDPNAPFTKEPIERFRAALPGEESPPRSLPGQE